MTRSKQAQVEGRNAAVPNKQAAMGGIIVFVAAQGEPYILSIDEEGGEGTSITSFADFTKPVSPQASPAEEVIDVPKKNSHTAHKKFSTRVQTSTFRPAVRGYPTGQ